MNYVWMAIFAILALTACSSDPEALNRKQAQEIITDWLNADGFFDMDVGAVYLCESAWARGIEQGFWSDVKHNLQLSKDLPELGRQYFKSVDIRRFDGSDFKYAILKDPVKIKFREITGIVSGPSSKKVEFSYSYANVSPAIAPLVSDARYGMLPLRLFDDGWRVDESGGKDYVRGLAKLGAFSKGLGSPECIK